MSNDKPEHEQAGQDPDGKEQPVASGDSVDKTHDKKDADKLVQLAGTVQLFTDGMGEAYAAVPIKKHVETHPLRGGSFSLWLQREFYRRHQRTPASGAVDEALSVLKGRALFDGATANVAVRLARHGDDIYLDLGGEDWQAVKIHAHGWQVVNKPPVHFIRPAGMQSLPMPVPGGRLDELRKFINMPSDEHWRLLAGFLLGVMNPAGPFAHLEVNGRQGSAKSTLSKMVKELIDPNAAPARAAIKNERDLAIAARNGHLLVFDNLSKLSDEMSDSLARLSTGGAFSTRKLYTDADEMLFQAKRPVILNGITELATKADLLERTIVLELPAVSAKQRLDEAHL